MINRRKFFKWLGGLAASGMALGTYAFAIEPGFRLNITNYKITPPRWTPGLKLKIAILSDPHCVEPHMPLSRWKRIIAAANETQPDMHLLLGDFVAGHFIRTGVVKVADMAEAAKALQAPLGTFGICGNHDWWDDLTTQETGQGPTIAEKAFEDAGIPMLENRVLRLEHNGQPFWLSGTSSMVAIKKRPLRFESRAKLEETLALVTDDAPIIHLAHEPDLFVDIPERVSLTLSGHTHGGQVRLFGYSPVTPSRYGNRFAYGHVVELGRHLLVSGGLGCSMLPIRFGMPPEIVVLELG
jgi:uncharacterized protein